MPGGESARRFAQFKRSLGHLSYDEQVQAVRPGTSSQSVQMSGQSSGAVKEAAGQGISGPSQALPHAGRIQESFGGHDVSGIKAHVGGAAATANQQMGSTAYATAGHAAFASQPSVHTAAHEAAHHVQQGQGVSLKDGIGQQGDKYEKHADAVADKVVKGQSAETLLSKGPAASSSSEGSVQSLSGDAVQATEENAVQKEEAGGAAPKKVTFKLAGRTFKLKLPANPKKDVTLRPNKKIGAFTISTIKLKFDESWKIKRGSASGKAAFSFGGVSCKADLKLSVSQKGTISTSASVSASIQAGPLSGKCKLKIGQTGVSGTANVSINSDIPLKAGGITLAIKSGSKGSATLKASKLSKVSLDSLKALVSDKKGKLVSVDGKGSWAASKISASGKAKLERSLSKKLGGFTLTLNQGKTKGEVGFVANKLKKIVADFSVEVAHSKFGKIGTGNFNGSYLNGGKKISGSGKFTLKPNDITFGNKTGFHVIAAKSGSSIGVAVASNKTTVTLNLASEIKNKQRVLASGSAQNVVYDGTSVKSGSFKLTIAEGGYGFKLGPLDIAVKSAGAINVSYKAGKLSVNGKSLSAELTWSGKTFKLNWTKWSISGGEIGPLPKLELPEFTLDSFMEWLKSLKGVKLDWLYNLFKRFSAKLPQFGGGIWTKFIAWLKRSNLSLPKISLGGGSFNISAILDKMWASLVRFFGTLKFNVNFDKLKELFSGLDLGKFNFGWFKKLFGGSSFSLQTSGNIGIQLRGEEFPVFEATKLSATLSWKNKKIATLASPSMSYDGTTFKARVSLTFEKDFGIPFGKYKVILKKIRTTISHTAGEDFQLPIPAITIQLKEGNKTLASGDVGNLLINKDGIKMGQAAFGLKLSKTLTVGGPAWSFSLSKGAQFTAKMNGTTLGEMSATNVGVVVKKGGARFATGKFSVKYADDKIKQASGSIKLVKAIKPVTGVTISGGELKADVKDSVVQKVSLTGIKVRFKKTLGSREINISGTASGVYNAATETLEKLEGDLTLKKPITVGSGNKKVTLQRGTVGIKIKGGNFQGLFFKGIELTATLGRFVLGGKVTGQIDDDGLTLKQAEVFLKKSVLFGTKEKGVEIHGGGETKVSVVVTKDEFKKVSLAVGASVYAGPFKAKGDITGTYDGEKISKATAKVQLLESITIGSGKNTATIAKDLWVEATVADGKVTKVAWDNVQIDAQIGGVGFGAATKGSWSEAKGLDIDATITLTTNKPVKMGNFTLTPTGGSVGINVKQSKLKEVTVNGFSMEASYKKGDREYAFGLSFTGGKWTEEGISGTATLSLKKALTVGPKKTPVVLDKGSASITLDKGKLKTISVSGLVGRLTREGEDGELAGVAVQSGTYDCEEGNVTSASVVIWQGNKPFKVANGVFVSGVNGSFTLDKGVVTITAGAMISAELDTGKTFSGGVQLKWKQGPEGGMGDFDGTKGWAEGVLIPKQKNGRYLGGRLDVEIGKGNSFKKFGATIKFALNETLGGTVKLDVLKNGEALDIVIKSGEASVQKTLLKKTKLVGFDFGEINKKKPGLDINPGPTKTVKLGIGGGFHLGTKDLDAEGNVTFGEWRPLKGGLPKLINAEIGLKWGFELDASLLAELGLNLKAFHFLVFSLGLSGGIQAVLDVDFNPTLRLTEEEGEYVPSLDFTLKIAPKVKALLNINTGLGIDFVGLNVKFPPIPFEFDLGTLFEIDINSGSGGETTPKNEGPKPLSPDTVPAKKQYTTEAKKKGDGKGVAKDIDAGNKKEGESGGIADLIKKAKLVGEAAKAIKGLATLIGLVIEGITAFMVGGPIGFIAWAVIKAITGGISDITNACAEIRDGLTALNQLIGPVIENDPDMKWLKDAMNMLDSKADDIARAKVARGEHTKAPLIHQAKLVLAMYAGPTLDEDEQACLRIFTDSPDLKALLIAVSGDIKAGVDEALGEFQGTEDTQLLALFSKRGLDWYVNVADDIYARKMVTTGEYKVMSSRGRGKLVAMLESGSCGDADEQAINKILWFSLNNGDMGGVLVTAFGSLQKAFLRLHHSTDGDEHDEWHRVHAAFGGRSMLTPSLKWAAQLNAIPSTWRKKIVPIIDDPNDKNFVKPEMTWDRALQIIGTKDPFNKPLSGDLKEPALQKLNASSDVIKGLTGKRKQAVLHAINGKGLRFIGNDLTVAILKGKAKITTDITDHSIKEFLVEWDKKNAPKS